MTTTQLQVVGQTTILDKSVNVFGTFEEPLFLAKEVAEWIEYSESNVSKLVQIVDDGEKVRNTITTPGGNQEVWMLTEDGLYEVLMQSRKPIAKAFKRQVKAYLKELRTKGITATPNKLEEILADPDTMIRVLTALKEEREQRQLAESNARVAESKAMLMEQINIENKPKVLFADSVAASKSSILIGELAKIIKQNGVEMGAKRLFDYLRENGFLIKRKGSDYNMPTQKAMELGLFEIKERAIDNPDGTVLLTKTSKVTGKGQVFFVDHFLRLHKPEKSIAS